MKKFLILALAVGICALAAGVKASHAGEIDLLLQKLVEKGVLTGPEAQQIRVETQESIKKEIVQGKYSNLPAWAQTIKMKGDLRVRYQQDKREGSAIQGHTTERNRGRVRFRLGAEAKANDQAKVYFGLATGGTDPRSTNQSFENSFELKDIRLDYAFAEYMLTPGLYLYGGRMNNPVWEPGDLLWDTDIHPEGGAAKFDYKLNPALSAYFNTGLFVLDENSGGSDPWMYVFQPGLKLKLNEKMKLNFATSYYNFVQVEGAKMDHASGSNTASPGRAGFYKYDFDALTPALELAITEPLSALGINAINVPYVAFFGEYVKNIVNGADEGTGGYLGGIKLGHAKVSDKGQWQARYMYAMLGTNAWPDFLPDSDRYGGRTGVRSHEVSFSYGLNKNVSLDVDYYLSDLTSGKSEMDGSGKRENLIQADLNFKF
ncbi:MAG: putative porin [Candidatus Omnitrophica bacterium]|nr:putative porin [Candidatus Omnitrophota bacterium]